MLTTKRFDGGYTIESTDGGTITLGASGDPVVVDGELTVNGTLTTVNTVDLAIADNVITLNDGEAGPGITDPSGQAGIEIDRGASDIAFIKFDETDGWIVNLGTASPAGDLQVLTGAIGAVALTDIVQDTSPQLGANLDVNTFSITATANVNVPILTAAGTGDITLTTNSTGDIVLTTATGLIRMDGPAVVSGADPSTAAAGDVALFQAADSGGGTELHFRNNTETGELVSKTKALVFGLIL